MTPVSTPTTALIGVGVLVFAQVLYVGVLIKICHYELLRWVLLGAPGIAACMTAYLSPNRKFLIGSSMALCSVVIGMVSAMVYEYFGFGVDRIGGVIVSCLVLLYYNIPLSVAGSVGGMIFIVNFRGPQDDDDELSYHPHILWRRHSQPSRPGHGRSADR